MSLDFTVYCKRPKLRHKALDAVCEKLGGCLIDDEEEDDDELEDDDEAADDKGDVAYRFDGFTLRVFEDPAGCRIEISSQDGFDVGSTDAAMSCMEQVADALGGSIEEDEWLTKSAAIEEKTRRKRAKKEGWLEVKGQPGTSRFSVYDAHGALLTKKILTSDALFDPKPESRILTNEGRKQDGIRKMEVISHDLSGNPRRRVVLTYDDDGAEIDRDDSGYV